MKLYVKEWFFLDGQELQGLGEPIIDKGRHPYIVILDSNNEHIGEYVIAVQGTTYRQTNVQEELLKDGDGVIVKLKNQSFIFTNHVHDDITGSMVAKVEGTISGDDLLLIGAKLYDNYEKLKLSDEIIGVLKERIDFTKVQKFESFFEKFSGEAKVNVKNVLRMKCSSDGTRLMDIDIEMFIDLYNSQPERALSILTKFNDWNEGFDDELQKFIKLRQKIVNSKLNISNNV